MEKNYVVNVQIQFTQATSATSKAKAIKQVKDTFFDEYGLEITDEEIVSVKLTKNI